jgi:hypothetical protein
MPVNRLMSLWQARRIAAQVRDAGLRAGRNLPVIYLPGILGIKLHDRDHQVDIWGDAGGLLRRRAHHADFDLHDDSRVVAVEPLHHFTIVPGLLRSQVTTHLVDVLAAALGYRVGRDLFFLSHDWRRDYRHTAARLAHEIARVRLDFGPRQRVIVIAQSVSNLAVRYWLRHADPAQRAAVARWYAFGPPWQGTYNAFKMLQAGYYPASRRFHGFSPAQVARYPSCYQLLPRRTRLIDRTGAVVDDFDPYLAEHWRAHRVAPAGFDLAASQERQTLQGLLDDARRFADETAGSDAREQQVPQVWFAGAANRAVTAAIREDDGVAVTDAAIRARHPTLAERVLVEGDDHIPLRDLTEDACGPLVRDADAAPYGENFVFISQAPDHRALINHRPNLLAIARDMATLRGTG